MTEKERIEIIKELAECNKDSCKDCKIICSYYSAITSFCEKVLPEGSVVLSKNEYEELNITGKYFNDALKQARKETAKEFAKELRNFIYLCDDLELSGDTYEKISNKMDELVKKFGVQE